jgi:(2Fe-2S) ferredoxin
LGIKAGETTADGKFSLEAVRCLGACALGPVVVVNEEPHAYMTPDKATQLIARLAAGKVERAAAAPAQATVRAPVDLSGVPPAG